MQNEESPGTELRGARKAKLLHSAFQIMEPKSEIGFTWQARSAVHSGFGFRIAFGFRLSGLRIWAGNDRFWQRAKFWTLCCIRA